MRVRYSLCRVKKAVMGETGGIDPSLTIKKRDGAEEKKRDVYYAKKEKEGLGKKRKTKLVL